MGKARYKGVRGEIAQLFKEVQEHGWEVERRRSGHFLMKGPNNQKVFCSATASDHRAVKNIKRDLANNGLDLK